MSMNPSLPAGVVVLDFGSVISRTLLETHALSEQALGLAAGTLRWRGPFDPATDEAWRDMQADRISERDYWTIRTREVGRLIGEDWHEMQTFVRRARGADPQAVIRPEAVETILAARAAGRRLAILPNELDLFYGADFRSRLPLLEHFEVVIDATYTGILKPDPRAYHEVASALGVDPGVCLMVDDQARNVTGALNAGMQAVAFDVTDAARSFAVVRDRLGLGR